MSDCRARFHIIVSVVMNAVCTIRAKARQRLSMLHQRMWGRQSKVDRQPSELEDNVTANHKSKSKLDINTQLFGGCLLQVGNNDIVSPAIRNNGIINVDGNSMIPYYDPPAPSARSPGSVKCANR